MTDTYNDTTGSRKKFLIPLVVLLLCAVSLTGAGYAYNSTVTIGGGDMDSGVYSVDTYTNGTASTVLITPADENNDLIVWTTATVHSTDNVTVRANSNGEQVIGTIYVKITATKNNSDAANNVASKLAIATEVDKGSATLTDFETSDFTFTYEVKEVTAVTADPYAETLGNAIQADNEGKYDVTANSVYKVVVKATFKVQSEADFGPYDIHDAQGTTEADTALAKAVALNDDFNDNYTYSVTFTAAPAA